MHKMTQAEFDALKKCSNGCIHIPEKTDCIEISFNGISFVKFGGYCRFGNDCKFDVGCTFGPNCEFGSYCVFGGYCIFSDYCRFGNDCYFGGDCKIGSYCDFGDCCEFCGCCEFGGQCSFGAQCEFGACTEFLHHTATFEGGMVENGLYITVGNVGSANRTAYFYIDKDGQFFVRAGCWFSTMKKFKSRVKKVHAKTIHYTTYMAACEYAKRVLPVMLNKAEVQENAQDDASGV